MKWMLIDGAILVVCFAALLRAAYLAGRHRGRMEAYDRVMRGFDKSVERAAYEKGYGRNPYV